MMKLKDYEIQTDGEIDVVIRTKKEADEIKKRSAEYKFNILLHNTDKVIGHINLRLGNDEKIVKYIGHIGYGIDEKYRGNKYAAKACKLIKFIAKENGLDNIIITCNPTNFASRNICENIGATLIDIVDIPKDSELYSMSETRKYRYGWK